MNFLHANEVLIRNEETRRALAASTAFQEVGQAAPFYVFRLKDFRTQMVDLVDRPLHWLPKKGWMEESFSWFRSNQRFASELPVFHDGTVPSVGSAAAKAGVTDLKQERHRISWRTDALGAAHLVRMAWHPRWQLLSKGSLHLAGPGFMLVIPQEAEVVLAYGQTSVGSAGMLASVLALLVLGAVAWRDRRPVTPNRSNEPRGSWPNGWLAIVWPLVLLGLGLWVHLHNPERRYTNAWELMRTNRYAEAAAEFDQAYAARKSEAKKEEALFWSAKASEQAGQRDAALQRYRQLNTGYHGYWLPESLYTQWQLARAAGLEAQSKAARHRLLQEFPNDRWTQRLVQETQQ
jgi:hypothetical protein